MQRMMIVAGAALCILVGFFLASALRLSTPGPKAGDWLIAAGGMTGVVVTILAAVWIEDYRSKRSDRAKRRRIDEALGELSGAIFSVQNDLPVRALDGRVLETAIRVERRLLTAIAKYKFVREHVEITDLSLWEALRDLDEAIEDHRPALEREFDLLSQDDELRDGVYRINRRDVPMYAGHLWRPLGRAQDALRNAP